MKIRDIVYRVGKSHDNLHYVYEYTVKQISDDYTNAWGVMVKGHGTEVYLKYFYTDLTFFNEDWYVDGQKATKRAIELNSELLTVIQKEVSNIKNQIQKLKNKINE